MDSASFTTAGPQPPLRTQIRRVGVRLTMGCTPTPTRMETQSLGWVPITGRGAHLRNSEMVSDIARLRKRAHLHRAGPTEGRVSRQEAPLGTAGGWGSRRDSIWGGPDHLAIRRIDVGHYAPRWSDHVPGLYCGLSRGRAGAAGSTGNICTTDSFSVRVWNAHGLALVATGTRYSRSGLIRGPISRPLRTPSPSSRESLPRRHCSRAH